MRDSIKLLRSLNQQAVVKVLKQAPPKGKKKKTKTIDALNVESYSKMRQEKIRKRKEFRVKHLKGKVEKETAVEADDTVKSLEYFELSSQQSERELKAKEIINSYTKV
jgi:hypothetical protein